MTEDVFGIVGTTQGGGAFRVERAVAEGGFSVIYRAQHGAFRAPVALKCLKVPGDLSAAERAAYLEKFREEAELLFRLSASIPEVVRPLHVDQLTLGDGRFVPFLALEWLQGEALDEIIDKRRRSGQAPMGLFKLVKLLGPVARGLARAHRFPGPAGTVSIVHLDIKPQNLFVASVHGADLVKILDFGIATAIIAAERGAGLSPDVTSESAFTPRYAAPEQWEPERLGKVGPWTDVWGLAITMVEALSGRAVFEGSTDEIHTAVFDESRRPTPRALGVVLADDAEAAFQRALVMDPKRRTRTVEALWTELEAALRLPPSFRRRDGRRDSSAVIAAPGRSASGRPLAREEPASHPMPAEDAHRHSWLPVSGAEPPRSPPRGLVPSLSGPAPAPASLEPPSPPRPAAAPRAAAAAPGTEVASPGAAGLAATGATPAPAGDAITVLEAELPLVPELDLPFSARSLELPAPPSIDPVSVGSVDPASMRGHGELDTDPPPARGARPAAGAARRPAAGDGAAGARTASLGAPASADASSTAGNKGRLEGFSEPPPPSSPLELAGDGAPAVARAPRSSTMRAAVAAQESAPPRPRRPTPARSQAPITLAPPSRTGGLRRVLRLPVQLMALGLAIAITDAVITRAGAIALQIGPLRPMWLGGLVFVAGAVMAFWRLSADDA